MVNKLLIFFLALILCSCSARNEASQTTTCSIISNEAVLSYNDSDFILDKVSSLFEIHGIRIYPIKSDYEEWRQHRELDICMLSHDTLFVKKYEFPIVDGLPVRLHESYSLDSIYKIEKFQDFSIKRDTFSEGGNIGLLTFRNDSICYDFGFTGDTVELVKISTNARFLAFDSIRVGDHIASTGLLRNLWKKKRIGSSINVILFYSTWDFRPSHWNHLLAKEIKQSNFDYQIEYEIENAVVSRINAYVSDNY